MININFDENQLKEIFKTVIIKLMEEKKELFSDFFTEIIEDIALEKAIKEGEETEIVSREAIFKILDNKE